MHDQSENQGKGQKLLLILFVSNENCEKNKCQICDSIFASTSFIKTHCVKLLVHNERILNKTKQNEQETQYKCHISGV